MNRWDSFKEKVKKAFAFQYSDDTIIEEYKKVPEEMSFYINMNAIDTEFIRKIRHFEPQRLIKIPVLTISHYKLPHYHKSNRINQKEVFIEIPVHFFRDFSMDLTRSMKSVHHLYAVMNSNPTDKLFAYKISRFSNYKYQDFYVTGPFLQTNPVTFEYRMLAGFSLRYNAYSSIYQTFLILKERFPYKKILDLYDRSFFMNATTKGISRKSFETFDNVIDDLKYEIYRGQDDLREIPTILSSIMDDVEKEYDIKTERSSQPHDI